MNKRQKKKKGLVLIEKTYSNWGNKKNKTTEKNVVREKKEVKETPVEEVVEEIKEEKEETPVEEVKEEDKQYFLIKERNSIISITDKNKNCHESVVYKKKSYNLFYNKL